MSSDDPAAILAGIRERYAVSESALRGDAAAHMESADDVPLLLKAVEAVLNRHARAKEPSRTTRVCAEHVQERSRAHARDLPAWRRDVTACPDCTVTEKWTCAEPSCRHECPDDDGWPCPTVRAITAALAGKGGTDEH